MQLKTVVLDADFCREELETCQHPEKLQREEKTVSSREIIEWIEQMQKDYEVINMSGYRNDHPQAERVQSFFLGNGIRKENALFISDKRQALQAAGNLNIAILACELSAQEGEGFPMVAERVWENDNDFLLKCYQREHKLPWEILRTEHLILREEWEEDLDRIYAMYEQPHITKFLEPPFPEREQELEYIKKYRCYVYCYYGFGLWHVIDKQTGLSAGRAGLNPKTYSDGVSGVELGYMIVEPFLQRGYCMEICEAILRYAKAVLEISEVYCLIRPDNKISIHIAEKLGFQFDQQIEDNDRLMWRFFKKLTFKE